MTCPRCHGDKVESIARNARCRACGARWELPEPPAPVLTEKSTVGELIAVLRARRGGIELAPLPTAGVQVQISAPGISLSVVVDADEAGAVVAVAQLDAVLVTLGRSG